MDEPIVLTDEEIKEFKTFYPMEEASDTPAVEPLITALKAAHPNLGSSRDRGIFQFTHEPTKDDIANCLFIEDQNIRAEYEGRGISTIDLTYQIVPDGVQVYLECIHFRP